MGVSLLGGWTAGVFGQAMWWLLVDAVSVWLGLIEVVGVIRIFGLSFNFSNFSEINKISYADQKNNSTTK